MIPEINSLPPEDVPLPDEDKSPPVEHPVHIVYTQRTQEKKTSPFKKFVLNIVLGVSIISAAVNTAPKPLNPVEEYLSVYPMGYYFDTIEECERMVEDELWYRVFGENPETSTVGPFYGTFASREELRTAVTVFPETKHFEDSTYSVYSDGAWTERTSRGLPYFEYEIQLPTGPWKGWVLALMRANEIVEVDKGYLSLGGRDFHPREIDACAVEFGFYPRSLDENDIVFGNGICVEEIRNYCPGGYQIISNSKGTNFCGKIPLSYTQNFCFFPFSSVEAYDEWREIPGNEEMLQYFQWNFIEDIYSESDAYFYRQVINYDLLQQLYDSVDPNREMYADIEAFAALFEPALYDAELFEELRQFDIYMDYDLPDDQIQLPDGWWSHDHYLDHLDDLSMDQLKYVYHISEALYYEYGCREKFLEAYYDSATRNYCMQMYKNEMMSRYGY